MNSFKDLSPASKIWVYQSNRELTESEVTELRQKADLFIETWSSHGNALDAAIELYYNRFIVIGVDEGQAMASGCSIDKSVSFIKNVEAFYNISLMDRMQVAYRKGESFHTCKLNEFEKLLKEGSIDENTIVFNNLVSTKKEFDKNWEVPLKNSWHIKLVEN